MVAYCRKATTFGADDSLEAGVYDGIGANDNTHLTISDTTVTGNYGDGIFAVGGASAGTITPIGGL